MNHSIPTGGSVPRRAGKTHMALACGLALHSAWVCSAMYSSSMFGTGINFAGVHGTSFSLLYLVSSVGFFLTALVACVIDQRLLQYARSRVHMRATALATCLATLLSLVPHIGPEWLSMTVEVLAGLVTGMGSAVLMLYWGVALAREDERHSVFAAAAAVAAGFALNVLVLQSLPGLLGGLVAAVLPFGEFALLAYVSPHQGDPVDIAFSAVATSKPRLGAVMAEATILMGFAIALLKQVSIQVAFASATLSSKFVVLAVAVGIASVPFVIFKFSRAYGDWNRLIHFVMPVSICVILLAALLVCDQELFFDMFVVAAYFLCEAFVWAFGALAAHRLRISPIFLFGLLRGTVTAAMLVGSIAIQYAAPVLDDLPPSGKGFVLLVILFVLLTARLMPNESVMVRNAVRCPAIRLMTLELDEKLDINAEHQTADAVAPEAQPSEAAPSVGGTRAADATAASASNSDPFGKTQHEQAGETGGKFSRKVRRVAETYMLTERETDILFEWVKGNGAAYIQEKYCISEGTVKTHIRNIYRKLNVHKKSDLMRLIDEIEKYD